MLAFVILSTNLGLSVATATCLTAAGSKVSDIVSITSSSGRARAQNLADEQGDSVKLFFEPSGTDQEIRYDFDQFRIHPGQCIYLAVPDQYKNKQIDSVNLGHRQDPRTQKQPADDPDDRQFPGKTSVQLHRCDATSGDAWRYWGGLSSGTAGSKYAEIRPAVEEENLYDWPVKGNLGVTSNDIATGGLCIDAARVCGLAGVSKDEVVLHFLNIKFIPEKADFFQEVKLTPGFSFGAPGTMEGRSWGEKQREVGRYPGAIQLGSCCHHEAHVHPPLPDSWQKNGASELSIPLQEGKQITGIEVAAGDQHGDIEITNKDGGHGTSGFGKIPAYPVAT